MKISEMEVYFQSRYPTSRSCAWDHDGLLVCPDRDVFISKVVTCLDVTFSVIEKAIQLGAQLIISHHPLIFSPIYQINEDTIVGQKILLLLSNGISLYSMHTRFDAAPQGLNVAFGRMMGVEADEGCSLLEDEPFIGALGDLPERTSPERLAQTVSRVLCAPVRLYSAELDVQRVCWCCGSGKDLIVPAIKQDADVFIGGDLPYHAVLDAVEQGMSVIDCTHHASERFCAELFAEELEHFDPTLEIYPVFEPLGGKIVDFS